MAREIRIDLALMCASAALLLAAFDIIPVWPAVIAAGIFLLGFAIDCFIGIWKATK